MNLYSYDQDTILNPKKLFPAAVEAACRAVVVVAVLRDAVVEVFKAAQNVLHLQIKHHVVARSTSGEWEDGNDNDGAARRLRRHRK